jgi:hypothetical protein
MAVLSQFQGAAERGVNFGHAVRWQRAGFRSR